MKYLECQFCITSVTINLYWGRFDIKKVSLFTGVNVKGDRYVLYSVSFPDSTDQYQVL